MTNKEIKTRKFVSDLGLYLLMMAIIEDPKTSA